MISYAIIEHLFVEFLSVWNQNVVLVYCASDDRACLHHGKTFARAIEGTYSANQYFRKKRMFGEQHTSREGKEGRLIKNEFWFRTPSLRDKFIRLDEISRI